MRRRGGDAAMRRGGAAALADAEYHATGRRFRGLPIAVGKLP